MKTNKKALAMLTAGLLAATPMATTGMSAFAATITVNKVTNDNVTHTYKAYPIITGTLADDGATLTAMTWSAGLDKDKLATALAAFDTKYGTSKFTSFNSTSTTPDQFAKMLENLTDSQTEGLAKVFNTADIFTAAGIALIESGDTYTATSLVDGWYVVKDETTAATLNGNGSAKSANILEVRGNTPAITPKFLLPKLEKKITDSAGANPTDANTAAIGDIVYYNISTNVPDVRGYDKYYFIVNDTLSPGLTYNESSLVVKIGEKTLNIDDATISPGEIEKYYVEKETDTTGTKIKIVFEDFLGTIKNLNAAKGTSITISYNATLNQNANIDPDVGNPNTANLTYSNNPNHEGDGSITDKPDEPTPPTGNNPSDIVGVTPDDKVNTYTTAIRIKKVDQDKQPFKSNVQFTLRGSNLNKVNMVSGTTFTEAADGTYWKLTTGAYTDVDPDTVGLSDAAKAKYANDEKKYKKVAAVSSVLEASGDPKVISSTVDEEGYITFYGLNAGEYTLVESVVPSGYNKADDIAFTIGVTTPLGTEGITWTKNSDKVGNFDTTNDLFPIEIENRKGSTLPSTGGIGTKLFYIIGSLLVSGSVVLLVTKKRMNAKAD